MDGRRSSPTWRRGLSSEDAACGSASTHTGKGAVGLRHSGRRVGSGAERVIGQRARRDTIGLWGTRGCAPSVRRPLQRPLGGGAVSGAPDGGVYGRAGPAEFPQFADGVFAGAVELDEVGFLYQAELGLPAAQPSVGLGDADPGACARWDRLRTRIGFELGDQLPSSLRALRLAETMHLDETLDEATQRLEEAPC